MALGKLIGKALAEVVKAPAEIASELGKAIEGDSPKGKPKK